MYLIIIWFLGFDTLEYKIPKILNLTQKFWDLVLFQLYTAASESQFLGFGTILIYTAGFRTPIFGILNP